MTAKTNIQALRKLIYLRIRITNQSTTLISLNKIRSSLSLSETIVLLEQGRLTKHDYIYVCLGTDIKDAKLRTMHVGINALAKQKIIITQGGAKKFFESIETASMYLNLPEEEIASALLGDHEPSDYAIQYSFQRMQYNPTKQQALV